jgi:RsiW-degrading membrane proteinase PrsW (M82 family)
MSELALEPREPEQTETSVEPKDPADQPWERAGLIAVALGLFVSLAACAFVAVLAGLEFLGPASSLDVQGMEEIAQLAVVLGLMLALGGLVVWRGWLVVPFHPRRTWLLWLLFFMLLFAGLLASMMRLSGLSGYISLVLLFLVPALVLGAVGRAMKGRSGTWRDVVGGLVGGGTIGAGLALSSEVLLALAGVALIEALGVLPAGLDELKSLLGEIDDPTVLLSPGVVGPLLDPVFLTLVLGGVTVVGPLLEEVFKVLAVGLLGFKLRPGPANAFLLGVASGAGFALAENLLNSSAVGLYGVAAVFSRLAATAMHCATSGLVGWGWGEFWRERRFGRLLLSIIGATGLHGLWNGLAFGIAVSGLVAFAERSPDLGSLALSALMILALSAGLLFLVIVVPIGMLRAGRALAEREGAV